MANWLVFSDEDYEAEEAAGLLVEFVDGPV